jgi:hypothetical protein
VASLIVWFICSNWSFFQGWLGLVGRCSIPLASQVMREAHGPGMDGGPVAGLLGELEAIAERVNDFETVGF